MLKYSSLIVPYTIEKTTIETIDSWGYTIDSTIASGHQLSQCIDLLMYRYTPSSYLQVLIRLPNLTILQFAAGAKKTWF